MLFLGQLSTSFSTWSPKQFAKSLFFAPRTVLLNTAIQAFVALLASSVICSPTELCARARQVKATSETRLAEKINILTNGSLHSNPQLIRMCADSCSAGRNGKTRIAPHDQIAWLRVEYRQSSNPLADPRRGISKKARVQGPGLFTRGAAYRYKDRSLRTSSRVYGFAVGL